MSLSPKQEAFCREYIIDWNGTQAAIRAGYSINGADVQASNLLRNIRVALRIDELSNGVAERAKLTADSVLADIATVKNACLGPVEFNPGMALKAAELEAKYLGILKDRHEFSGPDGGPIETQFWVDFVPNKNDTPE